MVQHLRNSIIVAALLPILHLLCFSQLVASHDLTDTLPQSDRVAATQSQNSDKKGDLGNAEENCLFGIRDGELVRKQPEKLSLKIVDVQPHIVHTGTPIFVTVRLTNEGEQRVLIPWDARPVEPVRTDPSTDTTSYENAMILLNFSTLEDHEQTSYLKGEATLFAAPDNVGHHIELAHGQWVEVKFKASIECKSMESWACKQFRDDEHAEITANWWEWLFTHEGEGCNTWRGAYTSRKIESSPYEVVYAPSAPN